MSNTYKLVNPFIQGDLKTTVTSKNSVAAAKSLYANLSEHFNNNIPKFYFTIQKGGSGTGKYYHFLVKEVKDKSDEVKFNVEPLILKDDSKIISNFESKLKIFKNKFEQAGGKLKKRGSKKSSKRILDDDDLDSSEELYMRVQTYKPVVSAPLAYWWYDASVYNLNSIYMPTFYSYAMPYLYVNFK